MEPNLSDQNSKIGVKCKIPDMTPKAHMNSLLNCKLSSDLLKLLMKMIKSALLPTYVDNNYRLSFHLNPVDNRL